MKSEHYSKREVSRMFSRDDIVAVIFCFLGSPDEPTRLKDFCSSIEKAIFQVRKKYPLLQHFAFSKEGASPQLEAAFTRLAVARILNENIMFPKAKKTIQERILFHFSEEQVGELEEIAKELEREVVIKE